MKKGYGYTIVFMILVSIFFTAILAASDTALKERIVSNEVFAEQQAILESLGIPSSDDPKEVDALFASSLKQEESATFDYYRQVDDAGNTLAYAVPYAGSGLWGTIRGYVGVSDDLQTMKGIVFTEQNETPGLGGRIQEAWFKDQFRGLDLAKGAPERYGSVGDTEIEAITGATQTSNAILRILQQVEEEILPELQDTISEQATMEREDS